MEGELRKLGGKVKGLRVTDGQLQNTKHVKYSLENIVKHAVLELWGESLHTL